MLVESLIKIARCLFRYRMTSWIVLSVAATPIGVWLIVFLVASVRPDARPYVLKGVEKLKGKPTKWDAVVARADRKWGQSRKLPYLEVLVLAKIGNQEFRQADEILAALDEDSWSESEILRSARVLSLFELGDFPATIEAGKASFRKNPASARTGSDCLYSTYAAGQLRDFRMAHRFFAAHYALIDDLEQDIPDQVLEKKLAAETMERLQKLVPDFKPHSCFLVSSAVATGESTAVFFLSSTQALGHAILDPYHFTALNRDSYDRLLFVGPPLSWYYPASAACVQLISTGNAEYVETEDVFLINLSWMSMGRLSSGNVDLVIQNYWSLLREVTLRSREPEDLFRHNSWHVGLPWSFESIGKAFAEKNSIDLSRPVVTLHARDIGYHGITKQSYRDVEIAAYIPAIQELLDQGYQVIRLGDRSMKHLNLNSQDYHELPFRSGYRCELDSFFIAHSDFMIGCQSGPCSFARALGRPLLSINSVYHYTLLPTPMEMGAFKHYLERDGQGGFRELGFEEILERRLYLKENSMQFDALGIELHALDATEILKAVTSMIEWTSNPDLALTSPQSAFAAAVEKAVRDIRHGPELAVADYIGISLPGYRIAPDIAAAQTAEPTAPASPSESAASDPRAVSGVSAVLKTNL